MFDFFDLAGALDLAGVLHLVLLCGFLGAASTFMVVTLINRMRLGTVCLSWPGGWRLSVLAPTVFVSLTLLLLAATVQAGRYLQALELAGYMTGGLFWLAATLLTGTTYVTRKGLTTNVNRCSCAVAWPQVVDYFSRPAEKRSGCRYVFFYRKDGARRRFEIVVPGTLAVPFARLVEENVDKRFEKAVHYAPGRTSEV